MTSPTPAAEPTIVGSTIGGRYRIARLLGEGGMGAVYEAEHTLMHKRVAVKVLHAEMSKMSEVVARFEREAMAAAHIEHPNVAAATDFGKLDDGSFFLVLEFIEGKSLREAISKEPFTVTRAIHIARQMASALSRAHGLGIVHRDLKPENVMLVTRDADPDFVKVLDFGIAKVPVGDIAPASSTGGQALTQMGMVYGTPEYMPPEQALGQEVDTRADLYALGVILWEMLAGRRPFDDESKVKLLTLHITAPVPPLPPEAHAPPELEALVRKLLAKEASERVQEVREVIEAFDALVTPPPGTVSLPNLPATASGPHPSLAGTSRPSLPQVATHPTVLALDAQAKSIAGDVARAFSPRVLMIVAGVLGVLTLFTVIALALHATSSSTASSASPAGSASAAPQKADPQFEKTLKKAQADLGASRWDDAITEANALQVEQPSRPEPYHVLFQAHVGRGDVGVALGDAGRWLAIDPAARDDAQLRNFVRDAVSLREHEDAAFALLESGKMGPPGAEMLYDLAYGPANGAQARARRAIANPEVASHASPALEIAIGLRVAKTCEARRDLLDRAAVEGDARVLAILDGYKSKGGCGFLGMKDCNACLRKGDALQTATEKLRARVNH